MPDAAEMRRRLDLVERTMNEVGWNGVIVRKLAATLDVKVRTIFRYRAAVIADLAAAHKSAGVTADRAEFLNRLRRYQMKAAEKGAWGSVAAMMGIESRVAGIDSPVKVEHSGGVVVTNVHQIEDRWATANAIDAELSEVEPKLIEAG